MWGRLRKGASSCGLKIAIIGVSSFPVFALVSPVSVSVLSSGYLNPVQWLPQPCSVATSTMFGGYLKESDAYVFVIYAWQCQDYLIFVSLSTCLKYQKVWQKKS